MLNIRPPYAVLWDVSMDDVKEMASRVYVVSYMPVIGDQFFTVMPNNMHSKCKNNLIFLKKSESIYKILLLILIRENLKKAYEYLRVKVSGLSHNCIIIIANFISYFVDGTEKIFLHYFSSILSLQTTRMQTLRLQHTLHQYPLPLNPSDFSSNSSKFTPLVGKPRHMNLENTSSC